MKKIGIVSLGYAWLPCEPGPSRFYDIAKIFAENGYEVDLIGSSFQHFQKKPRDRKLIEQQHYKFQTTFIDVPSYKKNIDIRRVYSNHAAAGKVLNYLKTQAYDVIYCSIPANNVAAAVGKYCRSNGIPLIIDIEDLWPEAMEMVVKLPVLRKVLFYPFQRDAETAYQCASAVIGTSQEYTQRAFKYSKRHIPHKTIYVGCNLAVFDKGVRENSSSITKPKGEFWVTYAGSIGTSYDIKTLVLAGEQLKKQGMAQIKIKILGTGPLKQELEQMARQLNCAHISFLGYTEYQKMAAYLNQSDVLLNSFVKGAPQSIVNKVGDYLSAGRPMINTLENEEFMNLVKSEQFGENIAPENVTELTRMIQKFYVDRAYGERLGTNARKLAEDCFDRSHSYLHMVTMANNLIGEKRNG